MSLPDRVLWPWRPSTTPWATSATAPCGSRPPQRRPRRRVPSVDPPGRRGERDRGSAGRGPRRRPRSDPGSGGTGPPRGGGQRSVRGRGGASPLGADPAPAAGSDPLPLARRRGRRRAVVRRRGAPRGRRGSRPGPHPPDGPGGDPSPGAPQPGGLRSGGAVLAAAPPPRRIPATCSLRAPSGGADGELARQPPGGLRGVDHIVGRGGARRPRGPPRARLAVGLGAVADHPRPPEGPERCGSRGSWPPGGGSSSSSACWSEPCGCPPTTSAPGGSARCSPGSRSPPPSRGSPWGGGLAGALALVEWAVATGLLWSAGATLHAALGGIWLAAMIGAGLVLYRRRRRWTLQRIGPDPPPGGAPPRPPDPRGPVPPRGLARRGGSRPGPLRGGLPGGGPRHRGLHGDHRGVDPGRDPRPGTRLRRRHRDLHLPGGLHRRDPAGGPQPPGPVPGGRRPGRGCDRLGAGPRRVEGRRPWPRPPRRRRSTPCRPPIPTNPWSRPAAWA